MAAPRAWLIDIDGTLLDPRSKRAVPGAVDAVRRLAAHGPVTYVTNTTSATRSALAARLAREGFPAGESSIVTPISLARAVLARERRDRGVLVPVGFEHADLDWFELTAPGEARAVLVAGEAHDATIGSLQPAIEALLGGAALYALQPNRIYRKGGRLVSDLGPLAAFLAYAAGVDWTAFGKPSPALFEAIARDTGAELSELVMVGDDAEFDVAGALAAGVGRAVLVRTGKYRPGDEERHHPPPTAVADSIADLPDLFGV